MSAIALRARYAIAMSLRLGGNLPDSEELTRTLGFTPTLVRRRGEPVSKKRVQPVDIWILDLAKFDSDSTKDEINNQMLQTATILRQMSPALAALDCATRTLRERTHCNTDLYISTIREEEQGGLSLPIEIVSAAAAARLSIQISILVMLDDYSAPEAKSELSTTAH